MIVTVFAICFSSLPPSKSLFWRLEFERLDARKLSEREENEACIRG